MSQSVYSFVKEAIEAHIRMLRHMKERDSAVFSEEIARGEGMITIAYFSDIIPQEEYDRYYSELSVIQFGYDIYTEDRK